MTPVKNSTLDQLAEQCRGIAADLDNIGKSAIDKAVEAGMLLKEARIKAEAAGIYWRDWLADNVPWSERHARRYIDIADNQGRLPDGGKGMGVKAAATMLQEIRRSNRADTGVRLTEHSPTPQPPAYEDDGSPTEPIYPLVDVEEDDAESQSVDLIRQFLAFVFPDGRPNLRTAVFRLAAICILVQFFTDDDGQPYTITAAAGVLGITRQALDKWVTYYSDRLKIAIPGGKSKAARRAYSEAARRAHGSPLGSS